MSYSVWLEQKNWHEFKKLANQLEAGEPFSFAQVKAWESRGDWQRVWDAVLLCAFITRKRTSVTRLALQLRDRGCVIDDLKRMNPFFRGSALVYIGNLLLPLRNRLYEHEPGTIKDVIGLLDALSNSNLDLALTSSARRDYKDDQLGKNKYRAALMSWASRNEYMESTNKAAARARHGGYR